MWQTSSAVPSASEMRTTGTSSGRARHSACTRFGRIVLKKSASNMKPITLAALVWLP